MIVVLNGAPRSGKSSIAGEILRRSPDWVADGVDADMAKTPPDLLPGIGLRPGGERPDLEPVVRDRFAALYQRVVDQHDEGRSVVVDVGHHDFYSVSLGTLRAAAVLLRDRPAWLVGVRCPIATIMARRDSDPDSIYLSTALDGTIPAPVVCWQEAVHDPGVYDLEVDTSSSSPGECADRILRHIGENAPFAFARIA